MLTTFRGFKVASRAISRSVILACPIDQVGLVAIIGSIGMGFAYVATLALLFLRVVQAAYPG